MTWQKTTGSQYLTCQWRRDECKVVFQRGKFHVIGGYETEAQGRFQRSAEAFDVASWQWDPVNEDLLETTTHPRTCVVGDDGKMYMCRGRDLVEKQGATWQPIASFQLSCAADFT
ncbi:F-box/kelch-repeat protein [Vitis vinifera]|uniref:F-box/kelch-repeat protein n=1 Tax=Vitis vinifera TaxID=29760 RepID=A0A438DJQ0_VITVI|nr:F-box/kelch-repeat protein [Vitis vinifera]